MIKLKTIEKFFFIVFLLFIIFGVSFIYAENLEKVCEIDHIDSQYENLSRTEYQALLEKCRTYYEEKSSQIEDDIAITKQEEESYNKQISLLSGEINRLQNEIYQGNLRVEDLNLQVEGTTSSIDQTISEIKGVEKNLIQVLRVIYEEDQKSLLEIFLSENKISDFFNNLISLELLGSKNKDLLGKIKNLRNYLENQKESLDGEKMDLEKVIKMQLYQEQQSNRLREDQQYLLALTESEYQQYLLEKNEIEEKEAQIKARIFSLAGISDAPTFGEAIQVADLVASQINIRPAFLLAIISQESAMGRNVGQCYVTNAVTGGGIYKNGHPLSRIMNKTRDLPIFLKLTGDNFSTTPVSCWIPQCAVSWNGRLYFSGASVDSQGGIICSKSGYVPFGFGGAMGPAQFIPSTWQLYEKKVTSYTGKSTANPWDIRDAFTASALLLSDNGAYIQSYWNEHNAASRYYGGSNSYANQVMTRASCIQSFISEGEMSYSCQSLIF